MWQYLKYKQLPNVLKLMVDKSKFLTAIARNDAGTVIVWIKDNARQRPTEYEFDLLLGRYLTLDERIEKLPNSTELLSNDGRWRIVVKYRIDPEAYICYQSIDVVYLTTNLILSSFEQKYYFPHTENVREYVDFELKKINFPKLYRGWSDIEKISYWANWLYRGRRSIGESGRLENNIFTESLIPEMRKTDPAIDLLLRDIIWKLAEIEREAGDELWDAFCRGTGFQRALTR